jgi:hypothetical protein
LPSIRPLLAPHHRQLLTALRDLADGQRGCPAIDELAATVASPPTPSSTSFGSWISQVPGRHAIRVLNPADGSDT